MNARMSCISTGCAAPDTDEGLFKVGTIDRLARHTQRQPFEYCKKRLYSAKAHGRQVLAPDQVLIARYAKREISSDRVALAAFFKAAPDPCLAHVPSIITQRFEYISCISLEGKLNMFELACRLTSRCRRIIVGLFCEWRKLGVVPRTAFAQAVQTMSTKSCFDSEPPSPTQRSSTFLSVVQKILLKPEL